MGAAPHEGQNRTQSRLRIVLPHTDGFSQASRELLGLLSEGGTAECQQLAENGTVAAVFTLAVAADSKVSRMRQGGQQVKNVGWIGFLHLGYKLALERFPSLFIFSRKR